MIKVKEMVTITVYAVTKMDMNVPDTKNVAVYIAMMNMYAKV